MSIMGRGEGGGGQVEVSASWAQLAWAQTPLNECHSDHDKWLEPSELSFSKGLPSWCPPEGRHYISLVHVSVLHTE